MSPRAPRKCPTPGCENRITAGQRYCPDHTEHGWNDGVTRTSTVQHKAWRAAVLKRDGYRCQIKGPRCTGKANIADHIINVAEGGSNDLTNGQAACPECHKAKTAQEAARGRARSYGHTKR